MAGVSKPKEDLTGMTFNEWHVLEYTGKGKWRCQCSCGTIREVQGTHLKTGRTKNCGHNATNKKLDLTGMDFGDWHVLSQASPGPHKETRWLCRCSCGNEKIITSYALRNGTSKSCGHSTTGFHDITGQTFNEWTVLRRSETKTTSGSTLWVCQCSCGTIAEVGYYQLIKGLSKSCGCKANEVRKQTTLEKYGVSYAAQIGTIRTQEQLAAISDKQHFESFLDKCDAAYDRKLTCHELGILLGIDKGTVLGHIRKFDLADRVIIGSTYKSQYEDEINELFPCSSRSNRKVISGYELDLYYPEQKLAIEFNGSYWHSSLFKDRMYHQKKTVLAGKQGVHLIHVFEYEWNNPDKRRKLIDLINRYLNRSSMVVIGARKCEIKDIDKSSAHDFLNLYHLQNFAPASMYLGCYYESELVGVMAFGKPRFNSGYDYELIRLCWKSGVIVTGGSQRMLKYFIDRYKPSSIITYCDISKFNGNSYVKMGFSFVEMTRPNYVWVNLSDNRVISRYQTTKQKLIAKGLGKLDQTENEIMENLGFLKIYDAGNFKFLWKAQKQEVS